MRFVTTVLVATIAGLALISAPVEAATTKKKRVVYTQKRVVAARGSTYVSTRDEDGRRRTRIIVQRRSYLDPGTEVFPGERRYNDSGLYQPTYSVYAPIENTPFYHRGPLPGPFDLPFPSNPAQWP